MALNDTRPLIAVPVGDPAGIGPEIVAKALVDPEVTAIARCVAIADARAMTRALATCGAGANGRATVRVVPSPELGDFSAGTINVLDIANADPESYRVGEISGTCGRAAYEYIEKAIDLALAGKVAAVSTAPINKEALRAGGIDFIGHTEIFGALTGTADPLTMFEVRGLRVFFLSRHVSLRAACDLVTKDRIVSCAARCVDELKSLGVAGGTLAVAGLNPHSGEHGMFGTEEIDHVVPAVAELRARGYDVDGPIGADSVFHLALTGRYAAILSLYHDQGHVATKTLDFERTVAVTCGMPILRTSVDHGTAMDIAGKGIASAVSMVEAIKVAVKYSRRS
jgi:4-phospho-D-threonate 3-dehydrogenase / 4-phospho-D-erythronate 3-dehydrogenase